MFIVTFLLLEDLSEGFSCGIPELLSTCLELNFIQLKLEYQSLYVLAALFCVRILLQVDLGYIQAVPSFRILIVVSRMVSRILSASLNC